MGRLRTSWSSCTAEPRAMRAVNQARSNGNAITWSIRWAPAATITSRSKPSATPAQAGSPCASAARNRSSGARAGCPRCCAPRAVGCEARALFGGVAELVKAVGEFQRAPERLEPRRDCAVHLRERRLARREVVQERQSIARERFRHHGPEREVEHVVALPGVAHRCRQRHADPFQRRDQFRQRVLRADRRRGCARTPPGT